MFQLLLAALLGYQDLVIATVAGADTLTVANAAGELAGQIRSFIAPLALVACSIFALVFLVQRQFLQMLLFIVIAVIVFAIFYVPEMLASLGESMGDSNRDLSWD